MKRLLKSTQFKKDIKRYANDSIKMQALLEVMRLLENETPLPERYRPHQLRGKYKGCMECHVNGDFLLIWIDGDDIMLFRLGSHSELFG